MKNLYRLCHRSIKYEATLPPLDSDGGSLMVVDPNNSGVLYVATLLDRSGEEYAVYRCVSSGSSVDSDGANPSCQMLLSIPGKLIGMEYLALSDELCLASAAGEVMVVPNGAAAAAAACPVEPDVVTCCVGGLEAMSWSPDQGVVVFVDW